MEGRLPPELGCVAGDAPEWVQPLLPAGAELVPVRGERLGVGLLHRPEAPEAAARVERAESAAAGVRHGAETRHALRDHHARDAGALALDADAVGRDVRTPAGEEGSN